MSQKPFTITEWSHCFPNKYAYETPFLIAANANKNDWDGLFQFAYSHGWRVNPQFHYIKSYFDLIANPQKLILCLFGSFIYHNADDLEIESNNGIFKINSSKIKGAPGFIKGESFDFGLITITSDQDGAIFLLSSENKPIKESNTLLLVTISEIKNKNNTCKNETKFNWGNPPALLKNLAAKIFFNINKSFKVFSITTQGIKGKQIETDFKTNVITFSTKSSAYPWFEIIINPID